MKLIDCDRLSLGYGGVPVSEPVSFWVREGDYLCIVGDNGSGKTTLMKTLLRLMEPLSGELRWDESVRRRRLGYLPQQTDAQRDFPATVREVILSGFVGDGRHSFLLNGKERETARLQAERLGLTNLMKKPFRSLSGGQQRRVLIARALCATDRILLLDEPTAGLDPHATEELYRVIHRLNREEGVTVLMITHDLAAVREYATSVLHMGETPVFFERGSEYTASAAKEREGGGGANE